jgi:outer membrane protein OmpA-like peptidoglycan-associated protein
VGFTHSGCACGKGKTIAIANVGAGVRKMMTDRSAFRIEASSQIGNGTPAFGMAMGMSFLVGRSPSIVKTRPTPPERIKPEPPVSVPPEGAPVQSPASPQPETPARVIPQDVVPSTPAPNLAGTVLLTIDGTQVDFNKPTWRDDAEPLLDGLAVDLTSDAGEKINISIEAHTDDIGSRMGNVALGMDRAKAVREFLVNQGINADRIAISSAGGDNPIAPNATALGRQRNRRIVIRRTN